jgi:hypothetical protein
MRLIRGPLVPTSLALLALLLFALQPMAYAAYRSGGGFLLLPLCTLATLAISLSLAQVFKARRLLGSSVAGLATALFMLGEAHMNTALSVMLVGPMAWWTEDLAGTLFLFGVPLVLISLALTFGLATLLAREAS